MSMPDWEPIFHVLRESDYRANLAVEKHWRTERLDEFVSLYRQLFKHRALTDDEWRQVVWWGMLGCNKPGSRWTWQHEFALAVRQGGSLANAVDAARHKMSDAYLADLKSLQHWAGLSEDQLYQENGPRCCYCEQLLRDKWVGIDTSGGEYQPACYHAKCLLAAVRELGVETVVEGVK